MDILGVGPLELIFILIIALLVFGPERLPEMGTKLGKALRDMRGATREFSREIEETRQAIEGPIDEIRQPIQEASDALKSVSEAVANPDAAIRQAVLAQYAAADAPADQTPAVAAASSSEGDGGQPIAVPEEAVLPIAPIEELPAAPVPAEEALPPTEPIADMLSAPTQEAVLPIAPTEGMPASVLAEEALPPAAPTEEMSPAPTSVAEIAPPIQDTSPLPVAVEEGPVLSASVEDTAPDTPPDVPATVDLVPAAGATVTGEITPTDLSAIEPAIVGSGAQPATLTEVSNSLGAELASAAMIAVETSSTSLLPQRSGEEPAAPSGSTPDELSPEKPASEG